MQAQNAQNSPMIYDSLKRGPVAIEELQGILQYRDLVFQLIRRDIVARYKRSVLGIAWTMLQPLGMMIILTLVFSQLFARVQGFPVYLLSGLIAWTFFAQTTTASMQQMLWGGTLLHRIYVPRTAFVVAAIGTGLVNISISIVPLLVVMLATGVPIHVSVLMVPYSMLLLAAFALGLGLLLSTLAVSFPDIAEMYQVVLVGWMYLTPIIYPKDIIPETGQFLAWHFNPRYWMFNLNPMYHLVEIFRIPLYGGEFPHLPTLAFGTAIALITLVMGWIVFTRNADQLAYRT